MERITRKQLLKGALAGAAGVAAIPLTSSVALADEGGQVDVHVHGTVRLTAPSGPPLNLPKGFPIEINVDVAGRRTDDGSAPLSGAGWDTGNADAHNQGGACYYAQRGRLKGDKVDVHGAVLFSNTPAFVGAPVHTTADLKTGEIVWTFGGLNFAGMGVVTKVD